MMIHFVTSTAASEPIDASGSRRRNHSRAVTWLFLIPALMLGVLNGYAKDSTGAAEPPKAQGKRSWKSQNGNISFQFDLSQWDFFPNTKGFVATHKKQDLMLYATSGVADRDISIPEFIATFKKSFEDGAKKKGDSNRIKLINEPKKDYGTYPFIIEYGSPSATKVGHGRLSFKSNVFCMVQLSGNTADAAARKEAILFEKAVTLLGTTPKMNP